MAVPPDWCIVEPSTRPLITLAENTWALRQAYPGIAAQVFRAVPPQVEHPPRPQREPRACGSAEPLRMAWDVAAGRDQTVYVTWEQRVLVGQEATRLDWRIYRQECHITREEIESVQGITRSEVEVRPLTTAYIEAAVQAMHRRMDEFFGQQLGRHRGPGPFTFDREAMFQGLERPWENRSPNCTLEELRTRLSSLFDFRPQLPREWFPPADFGAQAEVLAGPPAQAEGRYLCEFCFDQMTDGVLPADQLPTGLEMAWCGCDRAEEEA